MYFAKEGTAKEGTILMMYMQICLYDSVYERAVDAAEMQQKTEAVKKLLSGSATGEMNLKAVRITSSIDSDPSDELDIVVFTPAVWHLTEMYPRLAQSHYAMVCNPD